MLEQIENGDFTYTNFGDIAVSTKLGVIYVGGDPKKLKVNRIVKIVHRDSTNGKMPLEKDAQAQELLLDYERRQFNANTPVQPDQDKYFAALERALQLICNRPTTIIVYDRRNRDTFTESGRKSRASSREVNEALQRSGIYRSIYDKSKADAGDEFEGFIKEWISDYTGVPIDRFSDKEDIYTEVVPGRLGLTDERTLSFAVYILICPALSYYI